MTDFAKTLSPHTRLIVQTLITAWPDHGKFMEKSFTGRRVAISENVERWSERILKMIEASGFSVGKFCEDYRYLCGKVLEEEVHFRRTGSYRLSTFADAVREVYSNREFMDKYMNFLLLSHVLWSNHAEAMFEFEHGYLAHIKEGARHLEIGPGHGLLLHVAASHTKVAEAVGWDVSATSIEQTERCLQVLGSIKKVNLTLQDLYEATPDGRSFDSVVLAEVLEHLEDPVGALRSVSKHMSPNAQLWIHVPINSPAPDHLFLLRNPEHAVKIVTDSALLVDDAKFFPMTGTTLEKAVKQDLTISAVIRARKAA